MNFLILIKKLHVVKNLSKRFFLIKYPSLFFSLFRSKDQQLELVSLEDFYANAPPELTDSVRQNNL
jgi:hypothetical protein